MAVNMSDSFGSPSDYEPYTHFSYSSSTQLDFSFLPSHDTGKEHATAIFSASFPDNLPPLGLTGDTTLDDLLVDDQDPAAPRKRDRGERIVWTPEEDEYLRAAVQLYGDKTEKWAKIAACVPGRTNKNCRKRWFHSLDPSLRKGAWTEEEDHLLKTGVQMFKGQWSKIAERIQGRTDDQCAKRWRESLDPHIDRAAWTQDDDMVLLQRFEEFGSQWQKIALAFPGRPGLHCRNRWRKIQRSLNHMKRANKRRNKMSASENAAMLTETQKLEALLESHNDDLMDPSSEMGQYATSEDVLLMQDSFLDDDYSLESGIVLDEEGLATLSSACRAKKDDGSDSSGSDDEKPYGCAVPNCFFESSSPSLLFYHLKASHPGTEVEKPFRCTMPGCEGRKRYKNINGLQYHVTHAKNSPGHSGRTGPRPIEENQELSKGSGSGTGGPSKLRSRSQAAPKSIVIPPAPLPEHFVTPTSLRGQTSAILSNPPTPAEIQLQLHQSRTEPAQPVPLLTHGAFNIPHSITPLEGSATSSQTSSGASSPQASRPLLRCPEMGCDQTFHILSGLNAHMANSHGHRAMTMRNSDALYETEAIVMPHSDYADADVDMMDMGSGCSSPMDTALLMMDMDDSILRAQLDRLNQTPGLMQLDQIPTSTAPGLGMLAVNDMLFSNHPMNNRVHFGTHINVSANDPTALPPTPTTSASVSPLMGTPNVSPKVAIKGQGSKFIAKKFPCNYSICSKSYASMATLNNHIRNDHTGAVTPPTTASLILNPSLAMPAFQTTLGPASTSPGGFSVLSPVLADHASLSNKTRQPSQVTLAKADEVVVKPYKCLVPDCGKSYTNISGLKNHLLQTHGSTPKN